MKNYVRHVDNLRDISRTSSNVASWEKTLKHARDPVTGMNSKGFGVVVVWKSEQLCELERELEQRVRRS